MAVVAVRLGAAGAEPPQLISWEQLSSRFTQSIFQQARSCVFLASTHELRYLNPMLQSSLVVWFRPSLVQATAYLVTLDELGDEQVKSTSLPRQTIAPPATASLARGEL